ncbi:MAG: hypothetical protein K2J32_15215 [Ruminococcus sp.]|nr:hypothetical protein [Ruminococcus sp.]
MANNIIIITNDEQVKSAEYADYKDIQKAVDGTFDIYASRCLSDIYAHRCLNFRRADEKKICSLQLLFYCNDEELLIDSEEMNKVNAAAYMLNNEAVIYGNIAVLIDAGEGESRGFTLEETEKNCFYYEKVSE